MFRKRKQEPPEIASANALYDALAGTLTLDGRIRVEDFISAAAAIVGEAAIAAAGDFDPRHHDYVPGSRVFSTNINRLLCDDKSLDEAPPDSIFGTLRDRLRSCGYATADFPVLKNVFEYYAANISTPQDWGKVPLSVPQEHHPFLQPLRVTYETRAALDRALAPLGDDRMLQLRATTLTLAKVLCETRDAMSRLVATTLAIETVNGMANTAPITDAALAKVTAEQEAKVPK